MSISTQKPRPEEEEDFADIEFCPRPVKQEPAPESPEKEAEPATKEKPAEKPAEKVAPVERKKPRASADEELDRLLREYDAPRKKKINR